MAVQPIYQFYAKLDDYKPELWRRFQVPSNITMARLGYILMTMFEMQASHLFHLDVPFLKNFKKEVSVDYSKQELANLLKNDILRENKNWRFDIITEDTMEPMPGEKLFDATQSSLSNFIFHLESKLSFSYDYGDGWSISMVLEKIIKDKKLPGKELPRVLEGDGYGIIEDCGGPGGLENLAMAFKNKKGDDYRHYCEWLGCDDLDLTTFDIDDMNFRLKKVPRIYSELYELELEPTQRSIDILSRKYLENK